MASSPKGRASSRKRSRAGKARVISTKRKDALPRTGSVSAGRRKPVILPPIDALTEPPVTAAAPRKKKVDSLHQKERTASRKKATRATGRASATLDALTTMEIAQALAALEPVTVPALEPVTVPALEPVADTVAAAENPVPAYEEPALKAPDVSEGEALDLVESELDMNAFALAEEVTPAGMAEAPPLIASAPEPAMVAAPEPVAETVVAVERPATEYEEFAVTALETTEVEALAEVETELDVDAYAIVEDLIEATTAPSVAAVPPPIPEVTRARPLARATEPSATIAAPAPNDERRSRRPAISRLLSTLSRWTGVSGTK